MSAPLVPCAACARHLYADTPRCPFCDAPRAPEQRTHVAFPRMSRSAMAALGAALAVAPALAVLTAVDDAEAQTYRAPPRPAYGVPPPRPMPDAGVAPDASAPPAARPDAGTRPPRRSPPRRRTRPRPDEGAVQPLYGAPMKPSR